MPPETMLATAGEPLSVGFGTPVPVWVALGFGVVVSRKQTHQNYALLSSWICRYSLLEAAAVAMRAARTMEVNLNCILMDGFGVFELSDRVTN